MDFLIVQKVLFGIVTTFGAITFYILIDLYQKLEKSVANMWDKLDILERKFELKDKPWLTEEYVGIKDELVK